MFNVLLIQVNTGTEVKGAAFLVASVPKHSERSVYVPKSRNHVWPRRYSVVRTCATNLSALLTQCAPDVSTPYAQCYDVMHYMGMFTCLSGISRDNSEN